MGREVSNKEHRIPGIVTVSRGVNRSIELPPDLELEQQNAFLRIAQLRARDMAGVGYIAMVVEKGLPVVDAGLRPSLEDYRVQ